MKQRCESCNSCGMPLKNDEDFSMGDTNSLRIEIKYCDSKVVLHFTFKQMV